MHGMSRIGSFLFGQGVDELAAEESTRMIGSNCDGESHVGFLLVNVYTWWVILTFPLF